MVSTNTIQVIPSADPWRFVSLLEVSWSVKNVSWLTKIETGGNVP